VSDRCSSQAPRSHCDKDVGQTAQLPCVSSYTAGKYSGTEHEPRNSHNARVDAAAADAAEESHPWLRSPPETLIIHNNNNNVTICYSSRVIATKRIK